MGKQMFFLVRDRWFCLSFGAWKQQRRVVVLTWTPNFCQSLLSRSAHTFSEATWHPFPWKIKSYPGDTCCPSHPGVPVFLEPKWRESAENGYALVDFKVSTSALWTQRHKIYFFLSLFCHAVQHDYRVLKAAKPFEVFLQCAVIVLLLPGCGRN